MSLHVLFGLPIQAALLGLVMWAPTGACTTLSPLAVWGRSLGVDVRSVHTVGTQSPTIPCPTHVQG